MSPSGLLSLTTSFLHYSPSTIIKIQHNPVKTTRKQASRLFLTVFPIGTALDVGVASVRGRQDNVEVAGSVLFVIEEKGGVGLGNRISSLELSKTSVKQSFPS